MIDIHAHLCFPEFDRDREAVIEQAKKEIIGVVVSSARYKESLDVLKICEKHKGFLFASLGHHPTEGDDFGKVIDLIKKNKEKIVAVGEVGLDYHWVKDLEKQEKQKEIFLKFIELAEKIKKPLVIHSWDAEQACFDMVKNSGLKCIFHCYSGDKELAKEIADRGFWVSISTNICFSKKLRKVVKVLPLEKILLETDAPFLDPDRERKRNVPWNIKLSAEKIEKETGINKEKILQQARLNAIDAFNLPL